MGIIPFLRPAEIYNRFRANLLRVREPSFGLYMREEMILVGQGT
jgi:hypothetical protein